MLAQTVAAFMAPCALRPYALAFSVLPPVLSLFTLQMRHCINIHDDQHCRISFSIQGVSMPRKKIEVVSELMNVNVIYKIN